MNFIILVESQFCCLLGFMAGREAAQGMTRNVGFRPGQSQWCLLPLPSCVILEQVTSFPLASVFLLCTTGIIPKTTSKFAVRIK